MSQRLQKFQNMWYTTLTEIDFELIFQKSDDILKTYEDNSLPLF